MGNIDMHIHSTYSDGELTPRKILDYCNKNNITTISITDHENLLGSIEAINMISDYQNLKLIPGIELEADYTGGQLHILGYGISYTNKALNDISITIMEDNKKKIKSLIDGLYSYYGFIFSEKDLEELFSKKGNLGRPHVAMLCVKYGYTKSIRDTFKNTFKPLEGKFGKKEVKLNASECIKYIKDAGGIVSLAHHITLKLSDTELFRYIEKMANMGIDAVEVYHSSMSKEYTSMLIKYTEKLGLLQSGGSDYHGPIVKPNIEIGRGLNDNIDIKELSILSRL